MYICATDCSIQATSANELLTCSLLDPRCNREIEAGL